MSNLILTNAFRFLGLLLVQVLILKRIGIGWDNFPYLHVHLYPLFVLLLPLRTPKPLVMILAFVMGLSVDFFYDSLGVHASALVFMGFMRSFVLARLEPRGGYNTNFSPTKQRMGLPWFLRYASLLLAGHIFFYFSVEAFTFVYIVDIALKSLFTFAASLAFIVIYMFIFNPLD